MQARVRARLSAIAGRFPRSAAGVTGAVLLVIAGTGALGVHALRADTVTSPPLVSPSPSTSPLPQANAGPKNIVQVKNFTDGQLRVDGRVQLGREPGPQAGPVNIALALSSCTDCQTLAVALQINLISTHANVITPQNAAVATNGGCLRCDTIAFAYQYNIGVDDPTNVPPEVDQLMAQMKQEMAKASSQSATLADAVDGMNTVIGQYHDLATSLVVSRDESVVPGSPSDSAPASPSAAPAGSAPAPAPSDSPSPSPVPAASPSPSPSPSPSSSSPASSVSELPRRTDF